ncbi:MAG: DUF4258 domain-containing protein [Puniceicoccaceae bacterium]
MKAMLMILRFFLFFFLAPVFAIAAQVTGSLQDGISVVNADFRSESVVLEFFEGGFFNYDSSGALLQQRRSLDGKADDDDQIGLDNLETTDAELSVFGFFSELVAARTTSEASAPVGRLGNPMNVPGPQNVRTTIGGREFSGHALDQMQGRGIMPSVVDNTIRQGTNFPTRAGTTGFYDSVNNVRVIVNSETGRVVTVIPGAP